MATLQFLYRSKKDKGSLTIRFRHSSNIHYRYATKIVSNKEYWFTTKGKHKNLNDIANKGTAGVKNHKNFKIIIKSMSLPANSAMYNQMVCNTKINIKITKTLKNVLR